MNVRYFLSRDTRIPEGRVFFALQDGHPTWFLQCPECGAWGTITEDQLYGRVSVNHEDPVLPCTFHETRNWAETAAKANHREWWP